jgi:hypothetical protein
MGPLVRATWHSSLAERAELNIAQACVKAGWPQVGRQAFALFMLGKVTAGEFPAMKGEGLHADD